MSASSSSTRSGPSGTPLEVNDSTIRSLATLLAQSANPENAAAHKSSFETLASLEERPGFPIVCLKLSCTKGAPPTQRQLAAATFKNFVKKNWTSPSRFAASDRQVCKDRLPEAAASTADCPEVMSQLGEAITIISQSDFNQEWESLLPTLIGKLKTSDQAVIAGVLDILQSVFKRYANPPMSYEDTVRELLDVLPQIQEALHTLYVSISRTIENNKTDDVVVRLGFRSLLSLTRIYHFIMLVDLPEYFEDHCGPIFNEFRRYLAYDQSTCARLLVENPEKPTKPTLLHELQGAIFDCINIWSEKFESEFSKYLQGFAKATWELLVKYDSNPRYDPVITNGLCFLTTTAKSVKYAVFNDVLKTICLSIIAPHIMFRLTDKETFDECPFDYIRFDSEGADAETRRRACSDLLRALRRNFQEPITHFATNHVQKLLAEYKANPAKNWRSKDAAIFLIQAITIVEETQQNGVERINDKVPFAPFFTTEILPELKNRSSHALILADCIKFAFTFRNHLPDSELPTIFGLCATFIGHPSVVVHSYAATAVDRFLSVRRLSGDQQLRLPREFVVKLLQPTLGAVFKQLKTDGSRENHYLMQVLYRIAKLYCADIMPSISAILGNLKSKLFEIAKNPTNPHFHDLLFETIAALIAGVCATDPSKVTSFESALLQPFTEILRQDVDDFLPYVFQIIAQMLSIGSSLREAYKPVFENFLNPVLYENHGNIPGLVQLLRGYIKQDPKFVNPHLTKVLGVFQKLLSLKSLDHEGFYLMETIVEKFPQAALDAPLLTVCKLILTRMRNSQSDTPKFSRCSFVFFSLVCCRYGPDVLLQKFETIRSGFAANVLDKWAQTAPTVTGRIEKKLCILGFAKLLESQLVTKNLESKWPRILEAAMKICTQTGQVSSSSVDADYESMERTAYSAGFSRLKSIPPQSADPFPDIKPEHALARTLAKVTGAQRGRFGEFIRELNPELKTALQDICTQAQVSLSL